MAGDVVDDVSDASALLIGDNRRVVLYLIVLQGHLDVEYRLQAVLLVVGYGDLLGKVQHARVDAVGYALDHQTVEVVDVRQPVGPFLIGLDRVASVLHILGYVFSVLLDHFEPGHDTGRV